MREFRISEIGVEKTLAKAQKLAERAQKKGLSGGYQVRIEKRFEEIEGISHEYQVLVIEGEPVKFNGWQFIGRSRLDIASIAKKSALAQQ